MMHELEIRENRKLQHSDDASRNQTACSRREVCFSHSWVGCIINCIKTFESTGHFVEKVFHVNSNWACLFLNMTSEVSQMECLETSC